MTQSLAEAKHRRIPALDGLRGVAVLMVLFYHMAGGATSTFLPLHWFGELDKAGYLGVTLFFILSGFLITNILWESRTHPHWWRNFYARRALRIFPLYYLALGLTLLAAAWAHTFPAAASKIWSPALFLQNIPGRCQEAITNTASPLPLLHFWSLAVEEQFYLIWPLLLVRQRDERGAQRLFAATFFLSFVFRCVVWRFAAEPETWNPFLLSRVGEMAAGAWLAVSSHTEQWPSIRRRAPWLGLLGIGVYIVTSAVSRTFELGTVLQAVVGLTAITVGLAAVLVMALEDGVWSRLFRWRLLRWFGGISFGLYVFHVLLKPLFDSITFRVAPVAGMRQHAVAFIVGMAGSILVATVSYRFFEQPFLRLKRRFPE